uniref:Uncharacterized protein n=1 Tax=Rhizophora mucronata TaxID=61149 RepID=A0A2P2NU49_RHIMU
MPKDDPLFDLGFLCLVD